MCTGHVERILTALPPPPAFGGWMDPWLEWDMNTYWYHSSSRCLVTTTTSQHNHHIIHHRLSEVYQRVAVTINLT